MANINTELEQIRKAVYGREVRGSIANAIELINKEQVSTSNAQTNLDSKFNQLIINAGNSNAEVVASRVKADGTQFDTLSKRLDKGDEVHNTLNNEVVRARTDSKNIVHKNLKARLDNFDLQFDTLGKRLDKGDELHNTLNNEVVRARTDSKNVTHKNLKARLDNFDSQLNTKASKDDVAKISNGTPLFANSVSEMKDTTRNYVNLTDGYIYIYNGSNFEKSTILYQSQGIANDSIEMRMIKGGVGILNFYEYSKHCVENKFITSNGIIENASNAAYAKIPVTEGETISFWRASGNYSSSKGYTLFMDNTNTILEKFDASLHQNGLYQNIPFVTVKVPIGSRYLCFNLRLNDYDNRFECIVYKGEELELGSGINKIFGKYLVDTLSRNDFKKFLGSIKSTSNNLYDYTKHYYEDKYVNLKGDVSNAEGWGLAKIPVESKTTYSIFMPHGIYNSDIGALCFYDEFKKIDYHLPASDYIKGQYKGIDYITFETPVNCKNVLITCKRNAVTLPFDNSKTLICCKVDVMDENTIENYLTEIFGCKIKDIATVEHPLKGKKWGFIGDSLTERNSRTLKNYIDYITEETGIIPVNLGVSGSGYKKREDDNNAFYQRVQNIDNDFDIITIFGSGNDLSLNLGNVTDSDTSTVFGCVNETIKRIYAKMPTVKLAIISPTPWVDYPNYTEGNKMQLLNEGLERICKRGSIPFLDLYNCSNLRPWDATFRTLMYSRDDGNGVHPDEDGHKQFYKKILKFSESL